MNKNLTGTIAICVICLAVISSVNFVSAQGTTVSGVPNSGVTTVSNVPSTIFTLQNPLKVDSVGGLVQAFLQIVTYVLIIFAVLMFIYLGFQYVLNAAKGNAAEISKLHKQLLWLVVGVAIVISARVIVQVVINTLSSTKLLDQNTVQNANNALQSK